MAEADETSGDGRAAVRPAKSSAAFRTISEVADELQVAQHVLRFWESKFPQVRPLKRGGGRRYYRPEDIELLRDIRQLLYQEGYTIKGAQKLLRQRRGKSASERTRAARPAAAGKPSQAPSVATPDASLTANNAAPPSAGGPPTHAMPPNAIDRAALAALRDELSSLRTLMQEAQDED